ncbi:MAG: hypothetical protein ACRDSL_24565, partial [Pseudonocardiaceae bacterium]
MVTLRVGVGRLGVVSGSFAEGDAVADGDFLGSDEDVFDEQPQDASAFVDGGGLGLGVQLGEEGFQVGGEGEVGVAVSQLGVEGLDLVAEVGFPGAQVGRAGSEFVDGDQLFAECLDHAGDSGAGLGQRGVQAGA